MKRPLTASELRTLEQVTITTPRLETLRHIFVFQCYTGLAYIDVYSPKMTDIKTVTDIAQGDYVSAAKYRQYYQRVPAASNARDNCKVESTPFVCHVVLCFRYLLPKDEWHKDIWKNKDAGTTKKAFEGQIASHDVITLRLTKKK